MKPHHLFRYIGFASGILGALLIIAGIIGYFVGNFIGVANFSWFFWAANTFLLFAIFCALVFIGCILREKLGGE